MHTSAAASRTTMGSGGSDPLARSLVTSAALTDRDTSPLGANGVFHVSRDTDIFPDGGSIGDILLLRRGWACRYRLLDGRRQILGFLVPGDLIGPFTSTAPHFARTLTDASLQRVSRRALADGMKARPGLSAALAALIDAEYRMLAERAVRLERQNAKERMAHLMFGLYDRLNAAGLVANNSFALPVTQETIGDALGLSVVHVNRTIRSMHEEKIATIGFGHVTIHDLDRLSVLAGTVVESCRHRQPA
jgi:CRP-like cAMP-binding protein